MPPDRPGSGLFALATPPFRFLTIASPRVPPVPIRPGPSYFARCRSLCRTKPNQRKRAVFVFFFAVLASWRARQGSNLRPVD